MCVCVETVREKEMVGTHRRRECTGNDDDDKQPKTNESYKEYEKKYTIGFIQTSVMTCECMF